MWSGSCNSYTHTIRARQPNFVKRRIDAPSRALFSDTWPQRGRRAVQCATAGGDEQSVRVLLLGDIRAIFAEWGVDRLASAELVEALLGIEDHPWAEWKMGKPISTNGLADAGAVATLAPCRPATPTGRMLLPREPAGSSRSVL
jgi:hypothetical protein